MANYDDRIIFGEPERELTDDVAKVEANQARAHLQQAINRLNEQGWHNQFDYANYGVQYNPVYDKETCRVKTVEESGLTSQEYAHLANTMAEAPELTEEWNEERAEQIASKIFEKLDKEGRFPALEDFKDGTYTKEQFIKDYVEAVKRYHSDDEDFNYEIIKSLYVHGNIGSVPDPDMGM